MKIDRFDAAGLMFGCNGEIRIMPARYGAAWLVIAVMTEMDDSFWESWEDLVGGDNDYFAARDRFQSEAKEWPGLVYFEEVLSEQSVEVMVHGIFSGLSDWLRENNWQNRASNDR